MGDERISRLGGDCNLRYPALFECASLFEVQENTPVAGGETPSTSLGWSARVYITVGMTRGRAKYGGSLHLVGG